MNTNKTKLDNRVAKGFTLAIVIILLANIYLFATMTYKVDHGDQVILLGWYEGKDRVVVLAWQETHLALFETKQWRLFGSIISGKLHMVGTTSSLMPHRYFPSSSIYTNPSFYPGSFGTFLFTDKGYFQTILKEVKIRLYIEGDGSQTTYAYTTWNASPEEIFVNRLAQSWGDFEIISYDQPGWDPRMDCLSLWYALEDNQGSLVYNDANDSCSGNYGWPHGHE